MYVLGISAYFHDSAAALIRDGRVVMALEEERFSRIKHDNAFPISAIKRVLADARITGADLEAVAYYERPLRRFERILDTFVSTYPFSLHAFAHAMPEWLGTKIAVERKIRDVTGFKGAILYIPHHRSHAAAAFYPSPFEDAAILTIDGVGEYATTGLWKGKGAAIEHLGSIEFPHSLGLLYSAVTAFLGFSVNQDEAKVMGLAAYGKPRFTDTFTRLVTQAEDGSFRLDMRYFSFREGERMWSSAFEDLFGTPRAPRADIIDRDRDIAASLQAATEIIIGRVLTRLQRRTQADAICIGGGVALNATANGKIFLHTPFKHAYVFGAAGDDGAALGAALSAYHALLPSKRDHIASLSLGTAISDEDIRAELGRRGLPFEEFPSAPALADRVATLLASGSVVAWVQGRMEFGPRALGNRSILADPRDSRIKEKLNALKQREDFHPFACSILEERAADYFDIPAGTSSPFMTFCFPARAEKSASIAAVIHADGTSRIQTVPASGDAYRSLIEAFERATGVPCLLNTSFNAKGEPIVESAAHALDDFEQMPIDALALGRFLLVK